MNRDELIIAIGFICIGILIGVVIGDCIGISDMRHQAIAHHSATYIVKDNSAEFQWNP